MATKKPTPKKEQKPKAKPAPKPKKPKAPKAPNMFWKKLGENVKTGLLGFYDEMTKEDE